MVSPIGLEAMSQKIVLLDGKYLVSLMMEHDVAYRRRELTR